MKIKTIATFIFCALFPIIASARTLVIDLGPHKGKDVTKLLRSELANLSHNDQANILLSKKGAYYISGTVVANCNVSLTGVGENSKIVLCNGTDSNGFKAFTDDSFLEFTGTINSTISVSISNLSINLQDHKGIWWLPATDGEYTEKFAVKIYHAHSVSVRNVNSALRHAHCTNFNLRVCSNITFENNTLSNYNNSATGGILWIEGATENVNIRNNIFNKYGNDEAIAFYATQVKISGGIPTYARISKKDINITNNTFNYGYNGKDKASVMNDVLISFFTNGSGKANNSSLENLNFSHNKLNIEDPMRITMLFDIGELGTYHNLAVKNNQFINEADNAKDEQFYKTDIKINDESDYSTQPQIEITDNSFINKCPVLTKWGSSGLSHIQMNGGNVAIANNQFDDNQAAQAKRGGIIAYITSGAIVSLKDNYAKGLEMISDISSGDGVDKVDLSASGNQFEGCTTIYCDKVNLLNLKFDNNVFKSSNMNFFLQEFAKQGSVVFTNNNVYVNGGSGQLMTHWTSSGTNNLRFNYLEVKGNTFYGIDSAQKMLINIKSIGKKIIENNIFYHL